MPTVPAEGPVFHFIGRFGRRGLRPNALPQAYKRLHNKTDLRGGVKGQEPERFWAIADKNEPKPDNWPLSPAPNMNSIQLIRKEILLPALCGERFGGRIARRKIQALQNEHNKKFKRKFLRNMLDKTMMKARFVIWLDWNIASKTHGRRRDGVKFSTCGILLKDGELCKLRIFRSALLIFPLMCECAIYLTLLALTMHSTARARFPCHPN